MGGGREGDFTEPHVHVHVLFITVEKRRGERERHTRTHTHTHTFFGYSGRATEGTKEGGSC